MNTELPKHWIKNLEILDVVNLEVKIGSTKAA